MPRTAVQNQAIRDKRKNKITAVGIRLISTYGLENVVVDDIAKEVGCSHGLFYHYYKRTEDLFAAIPAFVKESKKLSAYSSKYAQMKNLEPEEAIRFMAKNLEELPTYPILALHTAHVIFSSKEAIQSFGYYEFFKKMIEDGQKEGVVKAGKSEDLMQLLFDTIGAYIARVIRDGEKADPIPAELLAGIVLK